jgi:hypothetical protein
LTAAALAVVGRGLNHLSSSRPANAAPTRLTMRRSFLFRAITLKLSCPGIRLAHLDRLAVETDPARQTILLVANRFFSCGIALAAFCFAIYRCALKNSSIDATPARLQNATGLARLFRRIETLTASGFAIFLCELD